MPSIRPRPSVRPWLAAAALLPLLAAARAPAQAAAPPAVRFGAEVGVRQEFLKDEFFAGTDGVRDDDLRLRSRLRVRAGATAALAGGLEAGVRLTTGDAANPLGGWVTPADLRRVQVQLDRAYLAYREGERLVLRAGADAHPLFTPTELVFDGDLQPMGLAQTVRPFGPRLTFAAGQYQLRETRSGRDANTESAYLLAHGVSLAVPAAGATTTLGLSQYYYHNADAVGRAQQAGELDPDVRTNRFHPAGRTIPDPRSPGQPVPVDYFSGFNILNAGLRVEGARLPFVLAADAALNLAAARDPALGEAFAGRHDLAVGAMLRLGRLRAPGSAVVGVGFFHIEADAVLAAFNSDDVQSTNIRSVPVELQYQLPGRARIVWDTFFQKKLDPALAGIGGMTHPENALRVRSRFSVLAAF